MPAPKKKDFSDALGDLLSEYAGYDRDELISAMELQIYALKEEGNGEEE